MWGAHTGIKSHLGSIELLTHSHVLASHFPTPLAIRASKESSASRAAGGVPFPLSPADKSHQVSLETKSISLAAWFGKVSAPAHSMSYQHQQGRR